MTSTPPADKKLANSSPLKGAASKRILVVEDDADSRAAIVTILETLGFVPDAYASGSAALQAFQSKPEPETTYGVALLDIMMPQMNGYELLVEMRKMPRYAGLPIIMVTAKDGDAEILDGYRYGADYYITKPFTAKQLDYGIRIFLPTDS